MKKSLLPAALAGAAMILAGCQQDNKDVVKKLDEISKKLDKLQATGVGGAAPQGQQRQAQRPGPDPTKVYGYPVDDLPAVGNPSALITVVKAYEYACPFCEKVRPTEDQLFKDYGDKIRIVYAPFVVHPQIATIPQQASCAGYKQGKFKEMSDAIWEKAFKTRQFDAANLEAIAKEVGLDMNKYAADMKGDCVKWVGEKQGVASTFGVGATPAFFINGRFLSGAQPLPAFKAIIDEELKKAEAAVASGTSAASYYKSVVVEKGLKKL
ncbi:MAG: thioredoxin domain-containing protein [Myxococcales bacterium]|nr:thioredoxin domain-containing protein [Myxococcales bacterium]